MIETYRIVGERGNKGGNAGKGGVAGLPGLTGRVQIFVKNK